MGPPRDRGGRWSRRWWEWEASCLRFNGAASRSRRKAVVLICTAHNTKLQWGRLEIEAEGRASAVTGTCTTRSLQWGRLEIEAEGVQLPQGRAARRASMGPPRDRGGRSRLTTP